MKTKLTDNFRKLRGSRSSLITAICAAFFTVGANAGPLDDFARNNGGSQLQIDIAAAIQSICPALVGSFGGLPNVLDAPDSANKDITLRCNELVLTAIDFADPNVTPSRTLGYTDSNDLLAALQQVTGEEIAAQNTMTSRASNSQVSNIAARLGSLRLAAAGAGTTGPATVVNLEIDGVGLDSVVAGLTNSILGGGASADSDSRRRAGFFINGSLNTGNRDQTFVENGFDFDAFGMTAGYDYAFDTGVLGVSIGYDQFSADFKNNQLVSGGDVEADGFSVSAFGMKNYDKFFIDGIVSYGQLDYDMDRVLEYASANVDPATCQCSNQNRDLISKTEGDHLTASVTAGFQSYVNDWLLQPTFGVSFRNYTIDGYAEVDTLTNGGMELRYGDQDIDSMRTVLGFQMSKAINREFGVLRPWMGVEWYHEFEDDATIMQAKYAQEDALAVSDPGLGFGAGLTGCLSCFQISSEEPDTDFGVVGVGLSFVFPNFAQLLFYYEGLVGYNNLSSNAYTINFRRQF